MTSQALLLAAIPFLFGLAVGRWWLLLMFALPATTVLFQGLHAGVPAGPATVMFAVPFAGACAGVALRSSLRRGLRAR